MLKRIAVLSDIHGNIEALNTVVADIKKRDVDFIINLGDHLSGPLWPKETAHFLMQQDWIQISGNHDRQLINQNPKNHSPSDQYAYRNIDDNVLDWLRTLPSGTVSENDVLLFHGSPSSDTTYLLETVENGRARSATQTEIKKRLGKTNSSVLLCGHTHIPRVVQMPENILIVNPGSVGLPAYDDVFPEPHVMEAGSHHARYAILENQNEIWNAEIVEVAYNYQKAAEQARKNNRPDWEIGLQTGFMN
jgi:putative phosphoesterase